MTGLKKFGISVLIGLASFLFLLNETINITKNPAIIMSKTITIKKNYNNDMNIASVVCGGKQRAHFALPLIKSAILFSETNLNIHLFTDITSGNELKLTYSKFTDAIKRRVKFIFYNASFPIENKTYWESLYKSCATQRIFYPNILTDVNEIIHFDADTIIVTKLENIWQKFKEISQTEIIGAANDCSVRGCAYYYYRTNHPVVGRYGINSGFLFMKLNDLRRFNFVKKIIDIKNSKKYILTGDQDMINILFSNHTDLVKIFDCTYNFFPTIYCNNIVECDFSNGIKIIHGVNHHFEKKDHVFHLLAKILIDIDLNKNKSEAIKEIISHIDNNYDARKCIVSKSFIFNEYRTNISL